MDKHDPEKAYYSTKGSYTSDLIVVLLLLPYTRLKYLTTSIA